MAVEPDNLLSNLLLPLYRAAREMPLEDFPDAVWALLHEKLRFDSGRWESATAVSGKFNLHRLHLHREPTEMHAEWEEVSHQDKAAQFLAKRGGTVSFTASTYFAGKETTGIREYTARYAHRNSLISVIRDRDGPSSRWLCLYRASENDPFVAQDRVLASKLLPHLEEAQAINGMAHLGRLMRNSQQISCAVIDRQGVICHAEPEFLALLAEELPAAPGKRLPDAINDHLVAHRHFSGRRIVVEASEGGGLLFLKGRLICAMDRLAPREREVARLVVEGLSYKQIAANLRISPATVRTTIQHIHDKLETHSLVALANRFKEGL